LPFHVFRLIEQAQANAAMIYYKLVTRSLIEKIHRSGRCIYLWTLDDPRLFKRFQNMGVDGIATNYLPRMK